VQQEFAAYLTCGRLEHGFLRVRCTQCHAERLVAFSCKRRGFCPSCGARRMVETAALLVDEVLPRQPLRQWVLSVPFPLRFLFATEPAALTAVLGIVYRAISTHLIRKAGLKQSAAQTGAVTLIQRFGSALNLNIHFHLLVLDGVYVRSNDRLEFRRVPPPTKAELDQLLKTITRRVGRHLERRGWLTRDAESSHLSLDREATTLDSLLRPLDHVPDRAGSPGRAEGLHAAEPAGHAAAAIRPTVPGQSRRLLPARRHRRWCR